MRTALAQIGKCFAFALACAACSSDPEPAAPASFRQDVAPILGLSCVASQCHDKDTPKAGMYLGPHYGFSNMEFDEPLTDAVVAEILANIVGVDSTTAAGVKRVAAGDPDNSFIMQKVAGTHGMQGHTCMVQETGVTEECGEEMPPDNGLCQQKNGQERCDKIAAWIEQGAKDN